MCIYLALSSELDSANANDRFCLAYASNNKHGDIFNFQKTMQKSF